MMTNNRYTEMIMMTFWVEMTRLAVWVEQWKIILQGETMPLRCLTDVFHFYINLGKARKKVHNFGHFLKGGRERGVHRHQVKCLISFIALLNYVSEHSVSLIFIKITLF